ncbi:unnamed protein product [Lampetra planeri]
MRVNEALVSRNSKKDTLGKVHTASPSPVFGGLGGRLGVASHGAGGADWFVDPTVPRVPWRTQADVGDYEAVATACSGVPCVLRTASCGMPAREQVLSHRGYRESHGNRSQTRDDLMRTPQHRANSHRKKTRGGER